MTPITGVAYQYFGWLGRALIRLLYRKRPTRLRENLEAAGMHVYPEAYMSTVGLVTLITAIACASASLLTSLYPLLAVPLISLALGCALPTIKARDRASKLDMEAPFAAAYISVMATGGLAPYVSIRRFEKCELLPNMARVAEQIKLDVELRGMDPITAIEKIANHSSSKEFRDFLMGYVRMLRVGGDVVHYLQARTEMMFRDLAAKLRAFSERAAMLLESYIAMTMLSTLGIIIVYLVSVAFRDCVSLSFSTENYLMFAYFILPGISILFIYLSDLFSFQEPIYEKAPYKVFAALTPLLVVFLITMVFPYMVPELATIPLIKSSTAFLTTVKTFLGLKRGYEPALGMAIALTITAIPAAIAHRHYTAKRGRNLIYEVTNFLRDLTESRKTGASPETCLIELANRPYGSFTPYLHLVARRIRWGYPFRQIYEALKHRVRSWFTLINLYILVDATDVGGGSPETLETMARYGEKLASLEKEKLGVLRPLMFMPYIGAVLLVFSVTLCLNFMNQAVFSIGRQTIPYTQLLSTVLPSIILQSYITGIVTGKVSGGSVSAGFKHAIILTMMTLIIVVVMPYVQVLVVG